MKWTYISEGLPEEDGPYLICAKNANRQIPLLITVWYYSDYGWSLSPSIRVNQIYAWMPLPKPPEVNK